MAIFTFGEKPEVARSCERGGRGETLVSVIVAFCWVAIGSSIQYLSCLLKTLTKEQEPQQKMVKIMIKVCSEQGGIF